MAPPEATRVTSPIQSTPKASMASRLSNRQDDDGARRSQPAPRAWGPGVNPITQKYNGNNGNNAAPQSNGAINRGGGNRPAVPDMSAAADKSNTDTHPSMLAQSLGQLCTLVTKEGAIFVGTLSSTKAKQAETLLLCRQVRLGTQADLKGPQKNLSQKQYVGRGQEHIMVFSTSQVASVIPAALAKAAKATAGKEFRTDTEISGNLALRERKLERWQAPADSALALNNNESLGEWDQFKVNQEKFGVKSDYDESHYTTVIDKNNPLYSIRERQAAKIAAEIEGDSRSNTFTEARSTNNEDYDEEDLYSGVRRDPDPLSSGQPDRYVPPSRRGQQQSPAAGNAFADPAIISAQIARKEPPKEPKSSQAGESAKPVASAPAPADKTAPVARDAPASTVPAASATATLPSASSAKAVAAAAAAGAPVQTQVGLGPSSRGMPDVRTAFKNFANLEKMKVQDHRRKQVSQDKAVKVNDLKKFAKNFKLTTPVPKDLLPILAKELTKQNEIVKKAQEQAESSKQPKPEEKEKSTEKVTDKDDDKEKQKQTAEIPKKQQQQQQQQQQPVPAAAVLPSTVTPVAAAQPAGASPSAASNGFVQRLEKSRHQHQQRNAAPAPQASPTPGQPVRPGATVSAAQSVASPNLPGSRTTPVAGEKKLSVSAAVFVPNAMAQTFKPGASSVSSPSTRHVATRPITPNVPQPKFLREAKARDARGIKAKPITAPLSIAKTIKQREEKQNEQQQQQSQSSSSKAKDAKPHKLLPPFTQRVDWLDSSQQGKEDTLPGYKDLFAAKARGGRNASHPASPGNLPRGPHPGPYPMANGMSNMSHMGPPSMPPQMPPQPHYMPGHYEDPHMRPPPMQPYAVPSPRAGHAYPSPVPHAPMAYQGGYMPGAHGMPPRQYSNGPGGMPGPHAQPPMMMAPQGSTGPYMQQQPPMPMQHGMPYQVPQPMYNGPPQVNGYPSPGRAPPMMPSGSHQGPNHGAAYTPNSQYASPVYHHQQHHHHSPHHPGPMPPRGNYNNQPHYPGSPYQQQQHPYPARTPSHGYAQPHQNPVTPAQAPPAQPVKSGEDAK